MLLALWDPTYIRVLAMLTFVGLGPRPASGSYDSSPYDPWLFNWWMVHVLPCTHPNGLVLIHPQPMRPHHIPSPYQHCNLIAHPHGCLQYSSANEE